ncbi:MAG: FTR1 family iron permease [Chroococcidiopsidaceae cyanobacterium CP_BM_ER_R8_30]|nr:FTR1 family iron permease [Chroococcidiopsidaceae cyanobacterium CP_BM_ER_R8_30]
MDFSSALPTFVITLREGVEAALVVGIVLACLKKAQQSQLNQWVYAGVGVGIAASALVGVLFNWVIQTVGNLNPQYTPVIEPLLEAAFGIVAISMLSWMLIWMTQQARFLKTEVESSVTSALQRSTNSGWGVFTLILIAVLREGFETVLFIAANFQQGLVPALGALSGLVGAVGIGILLFSVGVKINIRAFFQVMGILLLMIIAGLVVSVLKDVDGAVAKLALVDQTSSLCFFPGRVARDSSCLLGPKVWDTSNILPDSQFPGVILKALFGYREKLYFIQAVAYITFLLTVGGFYWRSLSGRVASQTQGVGAGE